MLLGLSENTATILTITIIINSGSKSKYLCRGVVTPAQQGNLKDQPNCRGDQSSPESDSQRDMPKLHGP